MFHFRPPTLDDAAMLLDWRKRPDVTCHMFTDVHHGIDEQRTWLQRCETRKDMRHFVIENDGRPVGYLAFTQIDFSNLHCSTGHYLAEVQDRRRLGGFMHNFIMDYCFYALKMNKVVNQFMAENTKVLKLQSILHYRCVGVYKEHIYKYGCWHDVHVFEMLKREWETHPHPFAREVTLAAYADWKPTMDEEVAPTAVFVP